MSVHYPIVFLIGILVMSCSSQEASEVEKAQVKQVESYEKNTKDVLEYCHPIREQDTIIIDGENIELGLKQGLSTNRCSIPDEDKERVIVHKGDLTIFDKKVDEIRVSMRLYVSLCGNKVLLAWGGVDPDKQGNLFDYEIYSLLNEQLFIEGGRSRERPTLNAKCQVNVP